MSTDPAADKPTTLETTLLVPGEASAAAQAPAMSLAGRRFGEYELLGELGRGGMGVVYKAREEGLNRLVALKMILPGALLEDTELQRFRAEAAAAATLQHPHIVAVHRVGENEERHFFTMDLIAGPSLNQRLGQGPLPGRTAARYLATIARAIHHAHQHGILHRDLKPANILLDDEDQPHVTDFGLAKHFTLDSGQTRTGAILGTPSYMAPEQALGSKDLGPACDIYGLGALLYELLTARPPFRGETPLDTLQQVLEVDPVPPRLLNPKVDRDLETICLKCLAKDPRQRYATALEMAEDLERFLQGDSIHARSLNVIDRLARTLERNQMDTEFQSWGVLTLWFAVIIIAEQAVLFVLLRTGQRWEYLLLTRVSQFSLMGWVFWHYRGRNGLPQTLAERHLWSIWIGYILASCFAGEACRQRYGLEQIYQSPLYPFWSVLAGMGFFVMGSNYWGRCYAIALAFFALALVMCLDLEWAPLEFGLLWSLTLGAIGWRLYRLGRERTQEK
jgi:hypothetical protein